MQQLAKYRFHLKIAVKGQAISVRSGTASFRWSSWPACHQPRDRSPC
jgi:hypothetical protein